MSTEPTSEAAFFSTIRSWGIVRSPRGVFGGVLGGVGSRIGMAPAPARIIFVLLAIVTGGIAVLGYAVAWALLPDPEGRIIIQDFGRGRPNVGALIAIGLLALVGFLTLGNVGLGHMWNWWGDMPNGSSLGGLGFRFIAFFLVLIPLALIGGLVALIVWAARSSRPAQPGAHHATQPGPLGYAALPDGTVPSAPTAPEAPLAEAATDLPQEATPEPSLASAPATASATAAATQSAQLAQPLPYAQTSVYVAPPPAAPRTTYTPRPRVPGPGKMGYLMALAWIPITAAIVLYLHTRDQLAVYPGIAGGVIYVAGLGLILVITALRGRKLGFLGFLSVIALIPVGLSIGFADDLRGTYADGGWRHWWNEVNYDGAYSEPSAEPTTAPPPAFNPADAFADYDTVAIDGTCSSEEGNITPDVNGTVALATVPASQTITVTSSVTSLVIPHGTSLNIVSTATADWPTSIDIHWVDRDTACSLNYGPTSGVQLTATDAPVLTVRLDDAQQNGSMTLYVEEN